jgi:hypothetical protein
MRAIFKRGSLQDNSWGEIWEVERSYVPKSVSSHKWKMGRAIIVDVTAQRMSSITLLLM